MEKLSETKPIAQKQSKSDQYPEMELPSEVEIEFVQEILLFIIKVDRNKIKNIKMKFKILIYRNFDNYYFKNVKVRKGINCC